MNYFFIYWYILSNAKEIYFIFALAFFLIYGTLWSMLCQYPYVNYKNSNTNQRMGLWEPHTVLSVPDSQKRCDNSLSVLLGNSLQ